MSTELYQGYLDTNYIREKAGFKGDSRVTDKEINTKLKTAETIINDKTNLSWIPYVGATDNPPDKIKTICELLAVALIRNNYPDQTDTWKKQYDLAMMLLNDFMQTNTQAQASGTGETFLSDQNADTNNPDAEPYLTTKNFSRDYIPTFRN